MRCPRRVPAVMVLALAVALLAAGCAGAANSADASEANSGAAKRVEGPLAPELAGIDGWLNSEPLKIVDLKGKVVLVDFWTYSCINCIRTLPYLKAWDERYRDQGLVIIGVHSPEFAFEKDPENVRMAIDKYGIKYPIALDNEHATWAAFGNHYWPHKYLIDKDRVIRYHHIGEGGYEETEQWIQTLLAELPQATRGEGGSAMLATDTIGAPDVNFSQIQTPEIYLGYARTRGNFGGAGGYGGASDSAGGFGGAGVLSAGEHVYALPDAPVANQVYFRGTWRIEPDYSELVSDAGAVQLSYTARALNIVAGSSDRAVTSPFSITLDDKTPSGDRAGEDAPAGQGAVREQRLYNLISDAPGSHTIIINATKGFRIYTFTFG